MTRERELLREVLGDDPDGLASWDECWCNARFDYSCPACEIRDRIRALLDESKPEPEYVWRVTWRDSGGKIVDDLYLDSEDAIRSVVRFDDYETETIERAPIGPWEAVSDE